MRIIRGCLPPQRCPRGPESEYLASIEEAIRVLRSEPLPEADSTAATVNSFLRLLQTAANSKPDNPILVFQSEVMFSSKEERSSAVAEWAATPADKQTNEREVGFVAQLGFWFRARATTLILASCEPHPIFEKSYAFRDLKHLPDNESRVVEARERHLEGLGSWHGHALSFKDRKLRIYDPAFPVFSGERAEHSQKPHLNDYAYTKRTREVVQWLFEGAAARSFSMTRLEMGGGGDAVGSCTCTVRALGHMRDIVLRWLQGDDPLGDGHEYLQLVPNSGGA